MLYLCRVKPLRHYLRGFLIAAWAGDKIAEFSFPEISFHFSLRPWFFFVSPAYAGKSPARFSSPRRCRDHPRMCGEKLGVALLALAFKGSPPHVRGKVLYGSLIGCTAQDHPRMCGEKVQLRLLVLLQSGSPPHVRGKGVSNVFISEIFGITPACAGKRLKRSRSTVPPVAIVPLFPSVCNKPVVSDGSPAGRDAPLFLPAENAVPASPAYNLRSL